jgi:hypothetical protein
MNNPNRSYIKIPTDYIENLLQPISANVAKTQDLLTVLSAEAFQLCIPEVPPAIPTEKLAIPTNQQGDPAMPPPAPVAVMQKLTRRCACRTNYIYAIASQGHITASDLGFKIVKHIRAFDTALQEDKGQDVLDDNHPLLSEHSANTLRLLWTMATQPNIFTRLIVDPNDDIDATYCNIADIWINEFQHLFKDPLDTVTPNRGNSNDCLTHVLEQTIMKQTWMAGRLQNGCETSESYGNARNHFKMLPIQVQKILILISAAVEEFSANQAPT